jgi:D-xylose transport system ATP-binding protein
MQTADILEAVTITKEFSGVVALKDVSFAVRAGEIHGLCGENGAGKSTLIKILSGLYAADTFTGQIMVKGKEQRFHSIRESQNAGIAVIYQELSLVPDMTLGENIFLGREPSRFGFVDWNEVYVRSRALLEKVGLRINPREKVRTLGIGQQQLVEIAKALSHKADILILDEPTSALSEAEVANLIKVLHDLRRQGVSCIFISHKFAEIYALCDRVTVLRDGRSISTHDLNHPEGSIVEQGQLIREMVGRELRDLFPKSTRNFGPVRFEVKGYELKHPKLEGRYLLRDIAFSVRQGEILGIAGLMGAGRSELLLSLFGSYSAKRQGEVYLDGKPAWYQGADEAIAGGLALVSEDRKRLGLILSDTVRNNMSLSSLEQLSSLGVIDRPQEMRVAQDRMKEMRIKAPNCESIVGNLSGGNQQKVVLARWMMTRPKVLFLDEPTRGIDVGARAEIYSIIHKLAAEGLAVVMVSSELPELLGMSDRIVVMAGGTLSPAIPVAEATQERIMALATRTATAAGYPPSSAQFHA